MVTVPEPEEGQETTKTVADYASDWERNSNKTGGNFKMIDANDVEYFTKTVLPAGQYRIMLKDLEYYVGKGLQDKIKITLNDGKKTPAIGILDPDQTYLVPAKVGDAPVAGRTKDFTALYGEEKSDEIEAMLADGTWAGMEREEKIKYLESMKGYTRKGEGGTQFHITSKFHKSLPGRGGGGKTLIGTLDISSAKLKNAAQAYADDLGDKVVDIFNALGDVVDNINNYFLGEEGKRQTHGADAITNATTLRTTTEQYIKETDERQMELPYAQAAAAAEKEAETEKSHFASAQKRASRQARQGDRRAYEEQKQPIVLDKLIEQMLNESFN